MRPSAPARRRFRHRWLVVATSAAVAAAIVSACGSSSKRATLSPSTTAANSSDASVTVNAATLPGLGTVLVNGNGHTLYLLTSEKGGKLTCTDDNGCTKVWPDTELPKGTTKGTAGSGVRASLLGTVKGSTGDLYLTYGGWPLYIYSGDPGANMANGEAITSFGGTWYVIDPEGNPVTSAGSGTSESGAATSTTAAAARVSPTTARAAAPVTTAARAAPRTTAAPTPGSPAPPSTAPPTTAAPTTTPTTKPCAYPPCYP